MSRSAFTLHAAEAAPLTASVESFDGTEIYYDLYEQPSRSCALIIPGFWRSRRHESMVGLAAQIARLGYRTAVMDSRGHGESGGTYGFNRHEHHDTAAVGRDLSRRFGVERITLIGLSYGGAIAVSTAARDELPLASLLLISPVADFRMIAPRINPLTFHRHIAFSQALRRPRFEWRMRRSPKIQPIEDIPRVNAPLCLIHVKNDWLIGHGHSVALFEAANEPKELHVIDIEGNYHADRILSVAPAEVEPIIEDFLVRYTPR